jgi:four helix bundle protein
MVFDLAERTTVFGEKIIDFVRFIPLNEITRPLINQLVRSGTSIGANYREANEASSKKDFRNKICISKKEASETKHWLRLIAKASPEKYTDAQKLLEESNEYTLIFGKIVRSLDNNS